MNLIEIKSNSKKTISKSQQTFNSLIKKIENLQKSIKARQVALDKGLSYYNTNVLPVEQKMVEKLIECIPIFYKFHKNTEIKLSKQERQILKELIQSLLGRVYEYHTPFEINLEIRRIIEDLEEIDFEAELSKELVLLKENITEFGTKNGLDIDLTDVNKYDPEELMEKLADAINEGMRNKNMEEELKEKNAFGKKKTKRQIEKEYKAKELAEMQKKGLSTIYKQLAKAFHPDLEQELSLKIEKEILMKRLTTAYENQDLHTLLTLEIEWMNRSTSDENKNMLRAEEQLAIYNAILKDQEKSLKQELHFILHHPKYFNIKSIIEEGTDNAYIIEALKDKEKELTYETERYSSAIKDLQQKNGLKKLKEILKEFSTPLTLMETDLFAIMAELFA